MVIKNRESIIRAFESKVGNRPCPTCGMQAGFRTGLEEHQIIGFERNLNGLDFKNEYAYISCAVVVCRHCGNVRMFALDELMDNPNYLKDSL